MNTRAKTQQNKIRDELQAMKKINEKNMEIENQFCNYKNAAKNQI
jgi:hypothetical protein